MKKHLISVQSGDWYDEANDDASMRYAKECGVEALDYNIDHVINTAKYAEGSARYELCDKPLDEFVLHFKPLKEASEKYGVLFSQMHAPFPIYFPGKDEVNDYIISVLNKIIAVCGYVGCPALVVHPYVDQRGETGRQINYEIYKKLIPAAKEYGVKICLENLFKSSKECIFTNAEEAAQMIDRLNEEANADVFGFCFDLGHATFLRLDTRGFINTLGKRLTVLHIHDNNGSGDSHLIPFTQADNWGTKYTTPWEDFIGGLCDIGYEGNLSFETYRGLNLIPADARKEGLSLITAIGRYLRRRIEE